MEPVVPGTNLAAVSSSYVDVLAHPGLISIEEAQIASVNGVFLEISGRKGHGLSNGHVVKTASEAGASIILDSDAHEPEDLMTKEYAEKVALGSGLNIDRTRELLEESPIALLHRLKLR